MHIAIMINKRYLYKVILDVDDKSTVIHSNNTYPNDLETQLYKMEPKIFRLLTTNVSFFSFNVYLYNTQKVFIRKKQA